MNTSLPNLLVKSISFNPGETMLNPTEVPKGIPSKVFYITTTDMPHYDQLLDPTKAEYFAKEKGEKGTIIWVTPDEALAKGAELHGVSIEEELRIVSEEAISKYAEMMKQGEKFPLPVLDYKRKDQEGRHRLLAAKKAGVVRVPVLIVEEVTEPAEVLKDYPDLTKSNPGDERLLKVAIEREPLRVAKQLGYEVHRLSPKDVVDKDDYARGYRYRLSKADPSQSYPQIVMARSEGEVATFLKRQIEGNPEVGTCYPDAWRYVMRNIEGVLVHGTIVGLRGRMSHAWVELPDGTVWDPSAQATMPIEKYYSLVAPIVEDRYTADEAAHMLSVGKHGPWTEEERQRILGGNPMPKTEAQRLSFHERIFGKGSVPPLTTLERGMAVNKMLPMPPEQGPPLPRAFNMKWPWK